MWVMPKNERWVRVGVIAVACLLFLPNLGAFGLWDPWETHYGAVTTNMVETYDWISPWWGYKEQIGTEPRQGNYFFSKPIWIFWAEASMVRLVGHGEWALRLPSALMAILAVYFVYLGVSRIWTRRKGLLAAFVMATCPQFFMISRQAQTDMPLVAAIVIALIFLMLAFFAPRRKISNRAFYGWSVATLAFVLINTLPQVAILVTDLDGTPPTNIGDGGAAGWQFKHQGVYQALPYLGGLALVVGWVVASLLRDIRVRGRLDDQLKDKWMRRWCMFAFYVMCAQAFYSKGLPGFLLPGAIIFFYLLVSWSWRTLARVELIRGILLFAVVGLPWYVAMLLKHGNAYWQRFFVHDHFNRLGAGVHQIDSGNFEHFIKWLGVGMWPWALFVPLALVWLVRQNVRDRSPQAQAKLFLTIWFVFAFALFTLMATKFHHYIFPAMPALAILTALYIGHVLEEGGWLGRVTAVVGVVFFLAIGWDIHEDPQHIRNLMTYKYDRALPAHLPIDDNAPVAKGSDVTWKQSYFNKHSSPTLRSILTTEAFRYDRFIPMLLVLGLVGLALFFFVRTRRKGLAALGVLATMLTVWSLNYYMPSLSSHWSQKYLFDAYYDTCTPAGQHADIPPSLEWIDEAIHTGAFEAGLDDEVHAAFTPILSTVGLQGLARDLRYNMKRVCQEDVISWLITWRGETYYSYNELQPVTKEQPQFMPYLEERNRGKKFYALMERGKMSGFKSKLTSYSDKLKRKGARGWTDIESWDVKLENDESLFFQMVSATPIRK